LFLATSAKPRYDTRTYNKARYELKIVVASVYKRLTRTLESYEIHRSDLVCLADLDEDSWELARREKQKAEGGGFKVDQEHSASRSVSGSIHALPNIARDQGPGSKLLKESKLSSAKCPRNEHRRWYVSPLAELLLSTNHPPS
jgi:hypothetical protein